MTERLRERLHRVEAWALRILVGAITILISFCTYFVNLTYEQIQKNGDLQRVQGEELAEHRARIASIEKRLSAPAYQFRVELAEHRKETLVMIKEEFDKLSESIEQ